MWLRLLWQLKELLPLLGKLLPLLEGWVAGNAGASAGTQKALAQLEARLGSSQEGLQDVGGQLRDQGAVLLHISSEIKQLRVQADSDRLALQTMERALTAELGKVRTSLLIAVAGIGLLLAGSAVLAALLMRGHSGVPGT